MTRRMLSVALAGAGVLATGACGTQPVARVPSCSPTAQVVCVAYFATDHEGQAVFRSEEFAMSPFTPSTGLPQMNGEFPPEAERIGITVRDHDGQTEQWEWTP